LIVVNNALAREILEDQLTAGNISVRHAQTGSAALMALRAAAVRGEPFGLALIDHSLPDTTGVELAHAMLKAAEFADLRVILLAPFDDDLGKVEESRVRRLTKPIRQSALWQCIAAADEQPAAAIARVPPATVSAKPGEGRARVLLVEDSPVNLEVGVAILESMGCLVDTAINGRLALDRHAAGEYSLIFMDCQMPEMDGFEATTEIRRREVRSGTRTPIVALTASVVEDGRRRCLSVGMDDFLAKPFTLDQMRAMLATWLKPVPQRAACEHPPLAAPPPPHADPIENRFVDPLRQRPPRPSFTAPAMH
jgi:CheY-like chemotaxis protein